MFPTAGFGKVLTAKATGVKQHFSAPDKLNQSIWELIGVVHHFVGTLVCLAVYKELNLNISLNTLEISNYPFTH